MHSFLQETTFPFIVFEHGKLKHPTEMHAITIMIIIVPHSTQRPGGGIIMSIL